MASTVVVVLLLKLFLERCTITSGSTHWIVTEDGRIQSQADSVFNLRRPYDLVAFMKQEERAIMINDLKKELLNRKDEIDENEDRDVALEERFYKTDPDCVEAGKPLSEYDLYISTVLPLENKGIRPEEHVDLNAPPHSPLLAPDCTAVCKMDFSMHTFEHLEGVKDRQNLSGSAELGLKNAITHRENVDDYGHLVYDALQKNKTSWVLFNMAAFYWRIKGEPFHAVECVRRALHYSPRYHKDVALISLANILHRAKYSNEAAIVVHAALDVSKELNVNHFTLGNIYAILGEYNKSVICFENTLKIQPDFEAAAKRRHAVLCISKLERALEEQHRSLQKTLKDLKDYQKKHSMWQQQNEKVMAEQVLSETKIAQRVAYEQQKLRESSSDMGEYCRMVDREGKQVLLCTWSRRSPDLEYNFAFMDQEEGGNLADREGQRGKGEGGMGGKRALDYTKPVKMPRYSKDRTTAPKYGNSDHMADEWPSKDECDTYVQKVPDSRNLSTVYLSPENKGFEVKALLGEAQGLKPGEEHPLPWYPPVCVPLMELAEGETNTYDHLKSVSYPERTRIPLKLMDPGMKKILLDHVVWTITEEEVGQRILTALRKGIGPSWVLYNLAGLYWRVITNNYQGVECLRRSLHLAPQDYRDVPLVNLANILYRWGRYDDAITAMKDALTINDVEPASHFFFGNLLWATRNYTGAMWHYRRALEVEPQHQEALAALRAIRCHQKYHQAAQSAAPQESPAQPISAACPQKAASSGQTESRIICKTENGEDKCIIETRTRGKSGDCNGHCTQTCTITPIKLDTCGGPERELNLDNAGKVRVDCVYGANTPITFIGFLPAGTQCSQKGATPQCPGDPDEVMFNGDFTSKLDEVSEYYEKKGLCQGDDCNQLRVQQGGQKPHIKLEFVDGVLHQRLIFRQAPSEMHVEPHECVIFSDSTKSAGCNRHEYRAYLADTNAIRDLQSLEIVLSQHVRTCGREGSSAGINPPQGPDTQTLPSPTPSPKALQLSDWELPDSTVHIGPRLHISVEDEDCRDIEEIEFQHYISTWLSINARPGLQMERLLDFEEVVKEALAEPLCDASLARPLVSLDHLPGVAFRHSLSITPENGLREVLQKLGGEMEPVEVVGTRIAHALQKNMTSWVLNNLAALYWRVRGQAPQALDCLRVALSHAHRPMKDVSMVSMANVLQMAGFLNDAIVATNMALEVASSQNQLPVSHFTLANLYAAKGNWDLAVEFYESTLGLQESFQPARHRLQAILCHGLSGQRQ